MKINIKEIRKVKGCSKEFTGKQPDFMLNFQGFPVTFHDIAVSGRAVNTGNSIYVQGKINLEVDLKCSRCLQQFTSLIGFSFEEVYQCLKDKVDFAENDIRDYNGNEIDLSEMIREELILCLPMKTLCKPDCRGLCPLCGQNLNFGECGCMNQDFDPRLAVLKKLISGSEQDKD